MKQIIYDMRHQPVVVWVTLAGTAMAVFLMMVIIITMQVATIPYAPESNRPRLLYGENLEMESFDNSESGSSYLSYSVARTLYGGLDGIERTSYFNSSLDNADVTGPTNDMFTAKQRQTDAEFWRIYDHTLLQGRYYTPEEVASGSKVAVVSESTGRRLTGSDKPTGQQVKINYTDYTIIGVVKDHSQLATRASGDVFVPIQLKEGDGYFGNVSVAMLKKDGVSDEHIRNQVKGRYAQLNTQLARQNCRAIYHEQPYDQETIYRCFYGTNTTPDIKSVRKENAISLLVLLILPAINLSSMLNSRMRRRVGEFGIRRAFGCTRRRLYGDIISENLLMTLLGGIIGLALSLVFAYSYSSLFATGWNPVMETPALTVLLNWRIISAALMICFVLNLISASIPAWKACRLNIVNAINATKQ